jgi:molybdate transport system substrate-binding protein
MKRWIAGILLAVAGAGLAARSDAGAQPARSGGAVVVAAAADLQTALPRLLDGFERSTGITSTVSFGSSGTFFAQIQNGAPFDVFFSADVDYPRRLVAAKQADADTLYTYASGRLVLWTRKDSGIDVTKGLAVLRDARVRRIALANPDLAPYGRAAVAALKSAAIYDAVKNRLVFGENIAQTAQLAHSGNADAALIAHSLAVGDALKASGTFVDVPPDAYPPVVQAAVVVSASTNKDAARALLRYLRTADAQRTLSGFGFAAPPR